MTAQGPCRHCGKRFQNGYAILEVNKGIREWGTSFWICANCASILEFKVEQQLQ